MKTKEEIESSYRITTETKRNALGEYKTTYFPEYKFMFLWLFPIWNYFIGSDEYDDWTIKFDSYDECKKFLDVQFNYDLTKFR